MTTKKKVIIGVAGGLAVLLLILAFVFLRGDEKPEITINTDTSQQGPVQITTAPAVARNIPSYIEGTGSFVADETTDVSPKVSGQVVSTFVNVGDFVQRGQVVARLDDKDARLRLEQSKSALNQAEVAVKQAAARLGITANGKFDPANSPEVQSAYQNYLALVQDAKLAAVNEQRYANLLKTGDTSRLTYDQQRTNAETTNARAKAALKTYENSKNLAAQSYQGIASAQAGVANAQTQVDIAQKAIADAVVYAPFSGSIDDRPVSSGEYVTPSSKIATIVRTSPIKLSLPLPEIEAGKVSIGMGMSASVAAYPEQNFAGRVAAIQPSLNAESRSIIIEGEFINSEGKLKPGMFGTARIVLASSDQGVFVPGTAVITDEATQSSSIYVIEEGIARLRVVQIGEREDEYIRIITGVAENETVATGNLKELFDGATVIQ